MEKEEITNDFNKEFNSCYYSSFVFIINLLLAYYYEYFFYSIIFALLFTTSIIYHSTYNIYTNILDKIAICLIVFYGDWLCYDKMLTRSNSYIKNSIIIFIITTFLLTIYVYFYGYLYNYYCFCEDNIIANYYHSFLHVLSSLGHICIIIL
jgi:hypothetical protein